MSILKTDTRDTLSPDKFYSFVSLLQSVDDNQLEALAGFIKMASEASEVVKEQTAVLTKATNDMAQEARSSLISRNRYDDLGEQQRDFNDYIKHASDANFILVSYDCVRQIQLGYYGLISVARKLKPKPLLLSEKKFDGKSKSFDDLQHMLYEFQLNGPAIDSFTGALEVLLKVDKNIDNIGYTVYNVLERYYQRLLHRHSVEGYKIHKDPVVTDVALAVYNNIDCHGEIADGKDPDEVSAYTVRKAEVLTEALRTDSVHKFISEPGTLVEYLKLNLKALSETASKLKELYSSQLSTYKSLIEDTKRWNPLFSYDEYDRILSLDSIGRTLELINDIDPRNIAYKEPTKILSAEEKFNVEFREETTKTIVDLLVTNKLSAQELVQYVLDRKSKLKKYFQDENSFYVCKIGGGNPFMGLAPGALEVIPGPKPIGNLDEIVGSGFDQVKGFINTIEDACQLA